MIRVLDVFSGIGGISYGLEATGGFETVAFCEIEPFCREVLRVHWPDVPVFDDVRTLTAESLAGLRPDAIVGGFPCQDVSVAGKGAGLAGARSGLWSEFARLVGELGPRWVLAENVGALRTRGVDRVSSDLEAQGYSVWPLLVGAWAAGAPHKRERIWIVAYRHGDGCDGDGRGAASESCRDGQENGVPRPDGSLAHRDGPGLAGERCGGLLDGERAASGHDADGRGERPVGDASDRESQESGGHDEYGGPRPPHVLAAGSGAASRDRGGPDPARLAAPVGLAASDTGTTRPRWPARPGEPQWEWEEPRLAYGHSRGRIRVGDEPNQPWALPRDESSGGGAPSGTSRRPELPLGSTAHGLPERLARRANREALKALGNSVVPQVVAAIGRAILAVQES